MMKATVEVQGRTLHDVLDALEEAARQIAEGFTSGSNSNEGGRYSIDVSGDDEVEAEEERRDKRPTKQDWSTRKRPRN